jgi:hypothetical protein
LSCRFEKWKLSASSDGLRSENSILNRGETKMKKNLIQLASLWLVAVFAVSNAQAQSSITVRVPFRFMVSDKTFPAGQYSVLASRDHLTLQDSTGRPVFIGIANAVSGRQVGDTGEVVFHCYDDRCFLSEYWTPTRENGSQLLPSRFEAELAKYRKSAEFALLDQQKKR